MRALTRKSTVQAKFGLFLAATLALAACGSGAQSISGEGPPLLPIAAASIARVLTPTQRTSDGRLYVASSNPYFFNEYALPLRSGEHPLLSKRNINEPVPVFDDGSDLYVGSFDDGTVNVFPVPLSVPREGAEHAHRVRDPAYAPPLSRARPAGLSQQLLGGAGAFASGLTDLSGLTEENGFLYIAGARRTHAMVLAYRLPLIAGERPSSSISTSSAFDLLAVAARNGTLFVASTIQGTVEAYALPLGKKSRPEFVIPTVPQHDGAAGIAVDASGRHLYVSLYQTGAVYDYRLPYVEGEAAKRLDVEAQTGGLPYNVALDATHLFVTSNGVAAYALPITSRSRPVAIVPIKGWATGVATGR